MFTHIAMHYHKHVIRGGGWGATKCHIVQKFDGGNIDELDEFPAICQYFPYQKFSFSYLRAYC